MPTLVVNICSLMKWDSASFCALYFITSTVYGPG